MLRVLLIAPEIPRLPRLAQTTELTRIYSVPGISVTPLIGPEVDKDKIQTQLRWTDHELLIWSGHGKDGLLLLPSGERVEPRWLASELRGSHIGTAILSVCDSSQRAGWEGFSDTLPAAGVNMIGMTTEVSDTAAIAYDVAVLQSLANGDSLRIAHGIGLEAMGPREAGKPQLYMADSTTAALRKQVEAIHDKVDAGANAEALRLAKEFVDGLEEVEGIARENRQRIVAIEQHIRPPWLTRALQVSAVAAIIAALVLIVFDETRLIIYSPLWNGVIIDILFVGWALLAWQLAINIRERKK